MRAEVSCTRNSRDLWALRIKRLSDDGTTVKQDVIEFDDVAFAHMHSNREITASHGRRPVRGDVDWFAGQKEKK